MPTPAPLAELAAAPFVEQDGFVWDPAKWSKWLGQLDPPVEVPASLPRLVDRRAVAEAVHGCLLRQDTAAAFAAVMVWGHGKTGYGPYRTAAILRGERVGGQAEAESRLTEAARRAWANASVAGFRYLTGEGRVPGLGPTFFTKWLSFCTADGDPYGEQAAPIYDAVVRRWLATTTGINLRRDRAEDYERYIGLLREWGREAGRSPTQVEATIFELARRGKR